MPTATVIQIQDMAWQPPPAGLIKVNIDAAYNSITTLVWEWLQEIIQVMFVQI